MRKIDCDLCGKETARPGWLRAMSGLDSPQIDLCESCAAKVVNPEVWKRVVALVHDIIVPPKAA